MRTSYYVQVTEEENDGGSGSTVREKVMDTDGWPTTVHEEGPINVQ